VVRENPVQKTFLFFWCIFIWYTFLCFSATAETENVSEGTVVHKVNDSDNALTSHHARFSTLSLYESATVTIRAVALQLTPLAALLPACRSCSVIQWTLIEGFATVCQTAEGRTVYDCGDWGLF